MSNDFEKAMARLAAGHRTGAVTPARVERAVLAEFDAVRRRRVWRRILAGGAVAAGLAAATLLVRERPAVREMALPPAPRVLASAEPITIAPPVRPHPAVRAASRPPAPPAPPAPAEQPAPPAPFTAIPYTVPLAPGERATVLRMMLSAPAMAAIGVPLPAIDPGGEAQADVLVGEDGRARAVRLVTNSSFHQ